MPLDSGSASELFELSPITLALISAGCLRQSCGSGLETSGLASNPALLCTNQIRVDSDQPLRHRLEGRSAAQQHLPVAPGRRSVTLTLVSSTKDRFRLLKH